MKTVFLTLLTLLYLAFNSLYAQQELPQNEVLMGKWKIDLTPESQSDSNFALMEITNVGKNTIEGSFYREGVKIQEGRVQQSEGVIHAALVSEDNSGKYNTSFYFKDGFLMGTTHSIKRDFLAVWKAVKLDD